MSELRSRIRRDLRNPLFRNGYALMANTAITATLGMGYWLLAAHFYTPEEFGRGQATITAMRPVASLTAPPPGGGAAGAGDDPRGAAVRVAAGPRPGGGAPAVPAAGGPPHPRADPARVRP